MGQQSRDRAEERAHGGIVRRDGDIVTLGDGAQWWLNGTAWARAEADALTVTTHAPLTHSQMHHVTQRRLHA